MPSKDHQHPSCLLCDTQADGASPCSTTCSGCRRVASVALYPVFSHLTKSQLSTRKVWCPSGGWRRGNQKGAAALSRKAGRELNQRHGAQTNSLQPEAFPSPGLGASWPQGKPSLGGEQRREGEMLIHHLLCGQDLAFRYRHGNSSVHLVIQQLLTEHLLSTRCGE